MVTRTRTTTATTPLGTTTRTERTTVTVKGKRGAKTVVDPITPVTPLAADVQPETTESFLNRMHASIQAHLSKLGVPSWTRRIVAAVMGLTAYAGIVYMALPLIDALVMAVIAYTGMGFLAFLSVFLGFFATLMLATTVGVKVNDIALTFEYSRVKARVLGWFTPKPLLKTEPVAS